ncbi:MAG: alpha-L-glutamate ligase-like protein [Parvularculaceae bacterium]
MFRTLVGLHRSGVIGVNERNVRFINAGNQRKLFHLVDDKFETKRLCETADIPTPELYGVVRDARDMRRLPEFLAAEDGCVIKPALGSQGKGIMVVAGPMRGGCWRLANGKRVTEDALRYHINNIISGMYSLGGQPDKALIEYRVKFDDAFEKISFKGVPDIRIIVLDGAPAAAMIRLPTADSDGKANLHRGGVGVGLDIATGRTARGMQFDKPIGFHPDTGEPLENIEVPYWDRMLEMAAQSYDVTKLGYIGVDLVLDRARGPMLLELNGRPGLSIQIAIQQGLRARLNAIKRANLADKPAAERIAIAKRIASTDGVSIKPAPSPTTEAPAISAAATGDATADEEAPAIDPGSTSVVPFPARPGHAKPAKPNAEAAGDAPAKPADKEPAKNTDADPTDDDPDGSDSDDRVANPARVR